MPTGYAKPGTLIYVDGAPVGDVLSITYPKMSGPGMVDTTNLNATKRTKISNSVMGLDAGSIKIKNTPASVAAFQVYCEVGAMHDVEIRYTNGQSYYMTAAKGGGAFFSDIDPGGASGADDTSVDAFTVAFNPSGDWDVSATAGTWYAGCTGLSINGGDFGLVVGGSPVQLAVYAIFAPTGFTMLAPVADLTFTSATPANCTVGANTGIVTWVSNGGATAIDVKITAAPTIDARCICTTA
jgi:hypothetical protein